MRGARVFRELVLTIQIDHKNQPRQKGGFFDNGTGPEALEATAVPVLRIPAPKAQGTQQKTEWEKSKSQRNGGLL